MYSEYFEDKTKLATPSSMAVPLAYRGKGLASVINEATVEKALEMGCDYIISYVVSPETIHSSAKSGYKVLSEAFYFDK